MCLLLVPTVVRLYVIGLCSRYRGHQLNGDCLHSYKVSVAVLSVQQHNDRGNGAFV